MMKRRQFLKFSALAALQGSFSSVLSRALAIPANAATHSIRDVDHIVILMQENRSFDHYYGTLRGVRGYGDPRVARYANGKTVFHQAGPNGDVLPFHPDAPDMGLQFLEDLPHDWTSTHHAWNEGRYDQWVPSKGPTTMAHLTRADIPYHYALADAFTICDAYHCSLMGPTDPNRYYMWSGWVGNDGRGDGPVVDNKEAGYSWTTYPERLEAAGISWKIYQDEGTGLDAKNSWGDSHDPYLGNYGDNSLLYFNQYRNAQPGSPLYTKAKTGTNAARGEGLFDHFRADVASNQLPSVSWICSPEAYSEHPNWPANYGAWFTSQVLDILTSSPDVWARTAFLITFDENDGFFDHMVPPTPAVAAGQGKSMVPVTWELFPGQPDLPAGPYGMGVRVPTLVVSPWSKGGWVNSQLFDHTSLIRFIEERFKDEHPDIVEPNITPWRRAVAGDLTSAFNFLDPNQTRVTLPVTAAYAPPDRKRHKDYKPALPTEPSLPVQEPGTRPARPLPYQLDAAAVLTAEKQMAFTFRNEGIAAAVFQVRSVLDESAPRSYTVAAGRQESDTVPLQTDESGRYGFQVFGPNGFYREFVSAETPETEPSLMADATFEPASLQMTLHLRNAGSEDLRLSVKDGYTEKVSNLTLRSGESHPHGCSAAGTHGWYDLRVTAPKSPAYLRHLAGHIENGKASSSDPAMAKASQTNAPATA